ncbi:MAG: hypothetical protein R2718_11340, partial [Solirubrobacterales bacterium]
MERRGRRKIGREHPANPRLSAARPIESVEPGTGGGEGDAADLRARREEIARLQERALHDAESARLKLA